MGVEYCHGGDHYVDLDYNVEGAYTKGKFTCWDHLTDSEQGVVEEDETFDGEFTVAQLATIKRLEDEDEREG